MTPRIVSTHGVKTPPKVPNRPVLVVGLVAMWREGTEPAPFVSRSVCFTVRLRHGYLGGGSVLSAVVPRPLATSLAGLLPALLAAQSPGWHRLPLFAGSGQAKLAFDSRRERTVLFESRGWSGLARTWERVGGDWSLRRTATTPPPRSSFGLTFDPWRQRVVLFGGNTHHMPWLPGVLLGDTWEYDGHDWLRRTPAVSPPPQTVAWLGSDHANGRLLMCGLSSQPSAGTWHYDGATWTASASVPFPSNQAGLGSDPVRQRIVAVSIGTIWGQFQVSTTHEWDGVAWTQLAPGRSPPLGFALTYDPSRGTVLLQSAGALREWDGVAWTTVAATPPQFGGESMTFDTTRGRAVMFGATKPYGRTTVEWDGASFHQDGDVDNCNAERESTWFDHNRGRVVSFPAGSASWFEWDGNRWHDYPVPAGGGGQWFAFDENRSRAVALQWSQGIGWRTAEWDGTSWTAPVASVLPCGGPMVYHAGRGRVLTVCGSSGIHEWDGINWTAVPSTGAPGLSLFYDLAYDAARNELVACAGNVWSRPRTFTWNGVTWTQHAPPTSPPAGIEFSMAYDVARQHVVLFGGRYKRWSGSAWGHHNGLWEWDGATWTERALAQRPPARINPGFVFDPVDQRLLLTGGMRIDPSTPLRFADVWSFGDVTAAAVGLGPGCSASGYRLRLTASHPHPGAAAFTVDTDGAPPGAPVLLAYTFAPWRALLPGGCVSYAPAPDHVAFTVANASGFASSRAAIPPALAGAWFAVQAATPDPQGPLGVALSPGLRVTVGY